MRSFGVLLAAVVCVGGCEGGGANRSSPAGRGAAAPAGAHAPASAAGPGAAADRDGWTMEVRGAVALTDHAPLDAGGIVSDYWTSDAVLRGGPPQFGAKVAARARRPKPGEPVFETLVMSCRGRRVELSFLPGPGSKYADVPFGPKTYAVANSGDGAPGTFGVVVFIDGDRYEATSGTVEVTRFDASALDVTFQLAIAPDGKGAAVAQVHGTLHARCRTAYPFGKCQR